MVAQGKPITGDQPFGYKNHDGKVVINEDEKDILIDIFNTYEKMQSQLNTLSPDNYQKKKKKFKDKVSPYS